VRVEPSKIVVRLTDVKLLGALSAFVATLLLTACASTGQEAADPGAQSATPTTATADHRVSLPTSGWVPGDPGRTALITGVVAGSASVDGGCVWLEGNAGQRLAVLWPKGYTATFGPVTVLDADGEVIAREDQHLRAGGAYGTPRGDAKCMVGSDTVGLIQAIPTAR
jgi:hypothetical protein